MIILNQKSYKIASNILSKGGLVAFPTETVFGLGVVFDNEESYKRLIDVKRRPPEKPFTLMCADVFDIYKYAEVNKNAEKIIEAFMPGQITIVVKAKKEALPKWAYSNDGTLGLRIPDSDLIRKLIRECGKPLLVPSANRSGEPTLTKSSEVIDIFENDVDAIIEGESISKVASTVVSLVDEIRILREGNISLEMITKVLEDE